MAISQEGMQQCTLVFHRLNTYAKKLINLKQMSLLQKSLNKTGNKNV